MEGRGLWLNGLGDQRFGMMVVLLRLSASVMRDLLVGVHLAAMSEAMAFCEVLGIDTELTYDIVLNAAGATVARFLKNIFDR